MTGTIRAANPLMAAALAWLLGVWIIGEGRSSDERGDLMMLLLVVVPAAAAVGASATAAVRRHSVVLLKAVGRGLLAGAAAGVVLGGALRLAMRLIAVAAGLPTKFSVSGTLFMVGFGAVFGASFGGLYATLRQRVSAVAFGVAIAALFWSGFFEAAARDLDGVLHAAGVIVAATALASCWIGYALLLSRLMRAFDPRA